MFLSMSDSMKSLDMETRRVGAGWKRKAKKSGKPYISFVLDRDLGSDEKILAFPNGFKNKENSPDFILYLSDQESKTSAPKSTDSQPEVEEMLS